MSVWSHVAAVIRIDTFEELNMDEIIGKECLWGSSHEIWEDMRLNPDNYLPKGSEGTLKKSSWKNPDKCSMASDVVTIFGDLRDSYDYQAIINWFKNKCKQIENSDFASIRQAVITVDNELHGVFTYVWGTEENESQI